uniref:DnaJ homolog subfamily C member 8 n=1 Tax=Caligus clemensi TaxID=344056 RepID=C1BZX4_CALCM|nr:DnaJ homolog subfamily C member 8 [Caligus clemensi]
MSSSHPEFSSTSSSNENFNSFYKDLKETEKCDSKLTGKDQIERLLRPGSTYRNLNPYEVLQIDPHTPMEEVKKKYKRLTFLVHPDKNIDDKDNAQISFDAVKKAFKMLEEEDSRKQCEEIVQEAEGRTKMQIEEKRKSLKKGETLPEDNPESFKRSVKVLIAKLFADLERKRQQLQEKISEEARKKRERELEVAERKNLEKEYAKNWEESRQGRVNSWQDFQTGKTKKKKKEKTRYTPMGFKPPKTKPESR